VPFGEPVGHEGVRVQVIRTDGSSLSVPICKPPALIERYTPSVAGKSYLPATEGWVSRGRLDLAVTTTTGQHIVLLVR